LTDVSEAIALMMEAVRTSENVSQLRDYTAQDPRRQPCSVWRLYFDIDPSVKFLVLNIYSAVLKTNEIANESNLRRSSAVVTCVSNATQPEGCRDDASKNTVIRFLRQLLRFNRLANESPFSMKKE
jgi:hypothetical protein